MIRLSHFMKPGIFNTAILLIVGWSLGTGCQSRSAKKSPDNKSTSGGQLPEQRSDESSEDASRPEVGKDV